MSNEQKKTMQFSLFYFSEYARWFSDEYMKGGIHNIDFYSRLIGSVA